MQCNTCGANNPEWAKFCAECGRKFADMCPACGLKLSTVVKYCPGCGVRLMSMGFLNPGDRPLIWRGPMLHSVVQQFVRGEAEGPIRAV